MTPRPGGERRAGRVVLRAMRLGRHLALPAMGALVATMVATSARLLGPLVIRSGIDDGINAGDRGAVSMAAISFMVLLVLQYFFQRVAQFGVASVGERFLRVLRERLFRHLVSLDMAFYGRSKTGVLVARMTHDIESIQEFVEEGATTLVISLLTIMGVAVAMLAVDPELGIQVLLIIVVLVVISGVFQRYAGRAYRDVREQVGRVLASLQEGITGVRVVQAFTQEGSQAGAFGRVNDDYVAANMRAAWAISWYFPAVTFLRTTGIGVLLFFGGRRVIDGDLSFGSLVSFLFYLEWFFQPVVAMTNTYNQLQSASAALAKVLGLLDTPAAIADADDAEPFPSIIDGRVDVEGVTFGYLDDVVVLADVELSVAAGERIAIVGETGAGKSTLARLALRFYDPISGRVTIDGRDLRTVPAASRAEHVVLIPQEGYLFAGTLRDNVRYARPEATAAELWEVAAAVGIDGWIRSLPERFDTLVRERGSRFSAGERQLVALARALLANPAVIVLDEATSNLDPETEARVDAALGTVLEGRTAIVIAHRLRTAMRADRVVMMDRGRIVAIGPHDRLVAESPAYARLVAVWERGVLR